MGRCHDRDICRVQAGRPRKLIDQGKRRQLIRVCEEEAAHGGSDGAQPLGARMIGPVTTDWSDRFGNAAIPPPLAQAEGTNLQAQPALGSASHVHGPGGCHRLHDAGKTSRQDFRQLQSKLPHERANLLLVLVDEITAGFSVLPVANVSRSVSTRPPTRARVITVTFAPFLRDPARR
jgi:hypothetical protein